jgi:hypothetical protein
VVSDLPEVWRQEARLQEELLALQGSPASPAVSRLRPQGAAVLRPAVPGLAPAPAVARSGSSALARFSAAVGLPVLPGQQQAGSGASAQPGAALQPEAQDAAVLPEAAVGAWAAAEVRLLAAERPGAAAGLQQEVRDGVAGQQPGARGAAVLQPEAPGGPAAALPSAAVSVFRRDRVLPWPEP